MKSRIPRKEFIADADFCNEHEGAICHSYYIVIHDIEGRALFVGHYYPEIDVFYNCLNGKAS